jgi:hypothetical protein
MVGGEDAHDKVRLTGRRIRVDGVTKSNKRSSDNELFTK